VLTLPDEHIQYRKGPGRPILNVNERFRLVTALRYVDYVVLLDEPDCLSMLACLKPDRYFKSKEDLERPVVRKEADVVQSYGGVLDVFPDAVSNITTTTEIIEKIKRQFCVPALQGRGQNERQGERLSGNFDEMGFPTEETFRFPNIVNVEVYRGACPCKCRHCPVGQTGVDQRQERFGERGIKLELYEKIVQEVSQHPGRVLRIHSVGEPLLWQDLPAALEISRRKRVKTWVFTSAVTANQHLLNAMCMNADIIEVSLNSVNRQDYLATKGVDAFDLVVENVKHMRKVVDARGATRLIVSRVQSIDRDADETFVRYWQDTGLVHDAFVRTYHTYNTLLPELPGKDGSERRHEPCLVHWARFNVSVKGNAVVCFNELFKEKLDPSLILGDVNRQSIAEIWHGPELTALRRAELSGDYASLWFGDALPCRDCYSCQPLGGNRQTSEHQINLLNRGNYETRQ
jgi:MoaA/NifB/PqqE/SkfB family radical SAM enzyme